MEEDGGGPAAGSPPEMLNVRSLSALLGCALLPASSNSAGHTGHITMRVELIGHFKPCMTGIYLHI